MGLVLTAPVAFAAALASATLDARYYALVSAQLFGVICAVVLISTLFTVLYLVGFGRLGRGLIVDRLPVFVGWTLLRSHRITPTTRSRLTKGLHGLSGVPRRHALLLLLGGAVLGLTAGGLELWREGSNDLAAVTSYAFVRWLQADLLLAALLATGAALPGLLVGERGPAPVERVRSRAAVNLTTFISIVGVSIGTWALIVVLSVMHGFEGDLRDKILRTHAHVVIEPEQASGELGDPFAILDPIAAMEGVTEVMAYAHGEVMMASATNIAVNVVIKGVVPEELEGSAQLEGRVGPGAIPYLDRPEGLVSDRWRYPLESDLRPRIAPDTEHDIDLEVLKPSRKVEVPPAILLGSELALSLHVDVGQELQVISPDGDVGPTGLRPKLRTFRVAGFFTTGMYEYDQKLAYMALDDAQRFFGLEGTLNRAEVRVVDAEATDRVVAAIRGLVAGLPAASGASPLEVTDWRERNRSLFSALQLERIVMFVVLGFIILVASLLIVSSLVMLIVEKARDIAVLRALGASSSAIVRTFLVIGGVIGAIGTASGLTLGIATCQAIAIFGVPLPQEYYISSLPVQMDLVEVVLVGLAALGICLVATIWPAREAAALEPVDGLRHG